MIGRYFFWCALWWLCALSAAAQVEVSATCPWQDRDGYTPVIVTVRSDAPTFIEFEAKGNPGRARLRLEVAPGQPLRRTLLVPGPNRDWSSSTITLAWRTPGQDPVAEPLSSHPYREFDVVVLDPAETFALKELRDAATSKLGNPPNPYTGYPDSGKSAYPETRCTRWGADDLPDRWQGYPAWLTVVMTPAGERALSEAQRVAISTWTTAGGCLMVTAPEQLASWQARGARVQLVSASGLKQRISAVWSRVARKPDLSPVPGTKQVPVYGFVGIAVLFALVVGPLNFWWCARRGRRYLILITTPLLSIGASVLLLGYGLLADGFTLRRSAVQVLTLDQASGRVSAWTGMTLFAGLPPATVELDHDALLVSLSAERNGFNQGPELALRWSDAGQIASGGWIPARANGQLGVGFAGSDKRRLAFTLNGSQWSVANGFDQPLTALWWMDAQGMSWHLEGTLAPGQSALLHNGNGPAMSLPLRRLPLAGEEAVSVWWPSAGMLSTNTYAAAFAGALVAIPGPGATDVVPVRAWVVGRVGGSASSSQTGF